MLTTEFKSALTFLEGGHASEALPILKRIVDRWPNYAAAQVAFAQALQLTDHAEDSLAAWCRAEALVSRSPAVDRGLRDAVSQMFSPDVDAESAPVEELLDEAPDLAPTDDAEPAHDTEVSDHSGTLEMDPALFVPIAVPFDEPRVEAEIPEWAEQPGEVAPSDVDTDEPEWNGGYAHDSGDGAGSDVDVELDAVPEEVELDRLIDELESAKIVPAEDPESVPEPDLSVDIDDVVSETLARIYATQSQYTEAARVYDRLALENPDRADEFETKASEMRARSR
ncbi:MAG: hypothetical protein HKN37_02215 [Rhodothermales bacterium]|nr:hypothetical protein [Rhodothermales bacterium]